MALRSPKGRKMKARQMHQNDNSEEEKHCPVMHRAVEAEYTITSKGRMLSCDIFLGKVTLTRPFIDCRSHNNKDFVLFP